jgi:hypothetical protein
MKAPRRARTSRNSLPTLSQLTSATIPQPTQARLAFTGPKSPPAQFHSRECVCNGPDERTAALMPASPAGRLGGSGGDTAFASCGAPAAVLDAWAGFPAGSELLVEADSTSILGPSQEEGGPALSAGWSFSATMFALRASAHMGAIIIVAAKGSRALSCSASSRRAFRSRKSNSDCLLMSPASVNARVTAFSACLVAPARSIIALICSAPSTSIACSPGGRTPASAPPSPAVSDIEVTRTEEADASAMESEVRALGKM